MRQAAHDRPDPARDPRAVPPATPAHAGGIGLAWLLPLLFCLPCLLVALGGTALAVAVSGVLGALTENVLLTLVVGGLGLALAVALVLLVRRRAAHACPPDAACSPPDR